MDTRAAQPNPRGGTFALVVLTAMNLLNYVDRFVPSAVKDLFKKELNLSDAETSYPLTAFVLIYMVASPVFGSLSDRWPRKWVIAFGVALWSLATGGAALAVGFWSFLLARAFVGIGEAAYATISPSLLSDFYAPARRNRVLTIFYVAIPVGSAIGFALGGVLGQHFGWRTAFLACGLPGLLAAGICLLIKDPGRGTFDVDASTPPPPWSEALRVLKANRQYVSTVAGYTAVTFASGALADWFPTFLVRERGMDMAAAGQLVGGAAVLGGLGGTITGGILADKLRGRTRQPYLALSACSMAIATVLAAAALVVRDPAAVGVLMVSAQFFMWFYNGPVNAILVNCVSSNLRARAFSLSILSIHLLGDAISPPLVGAIADAVSLPAGTAIIPVALIVGTAIWAHGWRTLPDMPDSPTGPGSGKAGPTRSEPLEGSAHVAFTALSEPATEGAAG